ncbi:AAA family ATPase [Candidatus Falkowbacteria bacterium]|uniref:Uncharacterized protein n=1 Tax=Candidatus Buchananbacteria bacterium CG10_big_fil_rev_8_21_14_0_10_33_19 TaxID=1974525 RepID=A0A2H0W665_9BACT|nr:AAA family ATPase [Candidatus Falkowbacteria bacterium]PIS06101.1 MAG: hypothetical protein COT80_02415 [Candidatus Buchananbacteria bacterium CG10_big_fil_rev_8_21_14_0_10_33_19]
MSKRIIVTGIPGSGTSDFSYKYLGITDFNIDSFNIAEILLKLAQESPKKPPIFAENLLNMHPELLDSLRDRAFDMAISEIEKYQEDKDRVLIDMHAQFFWNDVLTNAYDWRYLSQIDPDLFITLIEKPSTIRDRQLQTEQGRLQNHGLRDLLLWQNMEVNVTSGWASNLGKPHYVLPGQQDPEIIESLLHNAFLVYFQMPMTDASSEADNMITEFKNRLLTIGRDLTGLSTPLIDPRTIDIETGGDVSKREETAIRTQTVHRDMNWYIAQASDQVAYYPPGTTLSKGVSDETTRGFETGKNTFVIYSNAHTSPFMDMCTKVFTSEEEFFNFYPEYMQQRLERLSRH